MFKKIFFAAFFLYILYILWNVSAHMNDKMMRKYFMAPIKFSELVVKDNLSEREEKYGISSKKWLYGVNTPQKLTQYFDKYVGFEIDVTYDAAKKSFVVRRGADNILLDDILASQPNLSEKFFWLDLKNLDFNNKADVLKELIALSGRNILHKSHLIVVSPNAEYLDEFAANGFLTCFRFPSLYRVKSKDIRKALEVSVEKYKNSTVDFVCGDVRYFNFMDFYFPKALKMYQNTGREAKNTNPYILKRSDTVAVLIKEPDAKKER